MKLFVAKFNSKLIYVYIALLVWWGIRCWLPTYDNVYNTYFLKPFMVSSYRHAEFATETRTLSSCRPSGIVTLGGCSREPPLNRETWAGYLFASAFPKVSISSGLGPYVCGKVRLPKIEQLIRFTSLEICNTRSLRYRLLL